MQQQTGPPAQAGHFPDLWLRELFASRAIRTGGVVRRQVRDVERVFGVERFLVLMKTHRFQVVRNGEYLVIFCNQLPIQRLV